MLKDRRFCEIWNSNILCALLEWTINLWIILLMINNMNTHIRFINPTISKCTFWCYCKIIDFICIHTYGGGEVIIFFKYRNITEEASWILKSLSAPPPLHHISFLKIDAKLGILFHTPVYYLIKIIMIVRLTDTASAKSKYRIVDYSPRVSSWEQARAQCRRLGMDLVKIENSREDRALKSLLDTECSKYDRIYHRHLKNGYCNNPPHPKKSLLEMFLGKVYKCIFQFQLICVRGFEWKIPNLL